MPDLKGIPAMDALTILENMGMKVRLIGSGHVKKQSVDSATVASYGIYNLQNVSDSIRLGEGYLILPDSSRDAK